MPRPADWPAHEPYIPKKECWHCIVGATTRSKLPHGADLPMRQAVAEAFHKLTGEWPEAIFSGWGQEFSEVQQAIIDKKD